MFRTINSIKLQEVHFYISDFNFSGRQGVKDRRTLFGPLIGNFFRTTSTVESKSDHSETPTDSEGEEIRYKVFLELD